METAAFWDLVERSAAAHAEREQRADWLTGQLSRLPVDEIISFQVQFDHETRRAMTWLMWGAAHRILGFCSDDSFIDFRAWAIGLGDSAFTQVTRQPDDLAQLPEVQRLAGRPMSDWAEDEWPGWESLNYVAAEAYERLTGDNDGFYDELRRSSGDSRAHETLTDENWDFDDPAEAGLRLPKITMLFPQTEHQSRQQFDQELSAKGLTPADFFFGKRT